MTKIVKGEIYRRKGGRTRYRALRHYPEQGWMFAEVNRTGAVIGNLHWFPDNAMRKVRR